MSNNSTGRTGPHRGGDSFSGAHAASHLSTEEETKDEEKGTVLNDGSTTASLSRTTPPSFPRSAPTSSQSFVPTIAAPSLGAPSRREENNDNDSSEQGDGRPKNIDVGDQQPDINRRYDETASQQQRSTRRPSRVPDQHDDNATNNNNLVEQQSSSARPIPMLISEVVHPGAYPVAGLPAGARNSRNSFSVQNGLEQQRDTGMPSSDNDNNNMNDAQQDTVIANAVTTDDLRNELREEMQAEAVAAEVVVSSATASIKPLWKRKIVLIGGAVLFLASVGGIVGGVFASRGDGESPSLFEQPTPTSSPSFATSLPTVSPTADPTGAPTADPLLISSTTDLVEQNSFDEGLSLQNSSSPQYKALQWLLGNSFLGTYSNDTILQRYALATFYFSTNGTGWTRSSDWLSNGNECLWYSDSDAPCSDGEFMNTLYLEDENLVGTLPPELALLSASLMTIDLEDNSLSGPIPSEFGFLTGLVTIDLVGNSLSGPIPTEFGVLTTLDFIRLDSNSLSGPIPTEVGFLTTLEWLDIYDNDLSSSIPSQLGLMTGLRRVWLSSNNLNGSIPTEIGQITNLDNRLTLWNNILTGPIPSEIGRLNKLEIVSLASNQFTGTIPMEINFMTSLGSLFLYDNTLSPPFTCPSFIQHCYVSCDDRWAGFDSNCRQL